ncbi:MAG: WYL domain-containing protein [Eubacteriales bacterium]|nr:WYL domain-containing protein [Eubacteriales bacterium]
MPSENKSRLLYIMKYLWEQTDENHPVTIADIMAHLDGMNIKTNRKTVSDDIEQLQESGLDVVCNKSRQNQYFIGTRNPELPELKMLVDAVQAARFITPKKSKELIGKLSALTSTYQAKELNRKLYVDGRVKSVNENIYYIVDLLQTAINGGKKIRFQYYEYTAEKKRVLKHKGQLYTVSPYDLVWCNDSYYIFGYSEGNNHDKVIKFRVDRMHKPSISKEKTIPQPTDYDITTYCKKVFSMFDGDDCTVELQCENSLMKTIIDRFGSKVQTRTADCGHFIATVEVSASETFYAWVFMFGGKIKIISPSKVKDKYQQMLQHAIKG